MVASVSACIHSIRSMLIPSSWATAWAWVVTEPLPMSLTPVNMTTEPSSFILSITPVVSGHTPYTPFPWVAAAIPTPIRYLPFDTPDSSCSFTASSQPNSSIPFFTQSMGLAFPCLCPFLWSNPSGSTRFFNCMSMMLICKSLAILFIWHCWAKNSWGEPKPLMAPAMGVLV